MILVDYIISVFWLSPLFYLAVLLIGKFLNWKTKSELLRKNKDVVRKIDKMIFQIPTVGNVQSINKIFETVKGYNLPIPIETWAVIEASNTHKAEYVCDRVVVVPADFECEDLYKARALEYARRLRVKMVADGELPSDYILLQGDDDAVPSLGFIKESFAVNVDITIGTIVPRVKGVWSTIIDYERCVTCEIFCNFFTNMKKPLWAHGEGTVMSSKVDQNVSYDISELTTHTEEKLISSEDVFYFHKAALMGYNVFNSEEQVLILPPLSFKDAIKQRRRWLWGQIRILNQKMLPLSNRLRLGAISFTGLLLYFVAIIGLPLNYLGVIHIPAAILPFTIGTFIMWFAMRAYAIGKCMGWKHGVIGALVSYITVTLNVITQVVSLFEGDPRTFEVIRKE